MDRRDFLKYSGLASGVVALTGIASAGYMAGVSKDGNTGLGRTPYGKDQFFNRKPFLIEQPNYEQVGKTERIRLVDNLFRRNGEMFRYIQREAGGDFSLARERGIDALPDMLKEYYTAHPGAFDEFFLAREKAREQLANWGQYRGKYLLADAWSAAHASPLHGATSFPPEPQGPPDEADFEGVNEDPLQLKSPRHGTELIKKITHSFGATLTGVTAIRDEWVYQDVLRGVGRKKFEKPKHWKYAIVFAVAHEWESFYANPTYGTSYDAYSMLRFIGGKLEAFLKEIGYSARAHVPPGSSDLVLPPLAIDAGLGEQGRHGVVITPELGANTRLAAVSTDMPLEPDKPVDLGIKHFCNICKICAEECPGKAISFEDSPQQKVRGFKRWVIDQDKCYRVWNSVTTSHSRGCRICLSVCPYSRKNNWIHTLPREADPRDPTGMVASAMLFMQKRFFKYPGGKAYLPPPEGNNETYGKPPKWLKTDEWFNL